MDRRNKLLYMVIVSGAALLLLTYMVPSAMDVIGNYLTILVLVMLIAPVLYNRSGKN